MKKLFSILALAMVIGVFSSCVIVTHEEPTYTVYFNNDTPSHVYDWYLKHKYGNRHAASDDYCDIKAYRYDSISGIKEGDYKFFFCFLSTIKNDYYIAFPEEESTFYHINKDVTFYLSEQTPYNGTPRSAVGSDDTYENLDNLVIKDSEGNVYPLKKVAK